MGYTRFREAIRFTRHGRDSLKQMFVGSVLVTVWWLGIPAAAITGYLVRVLEMTSTGRAYLPVFDEWRELVATGGRALAIAFTYAVVPVLALLFVVVRSVELPPGAVIPEIALTPLDAGVALISVGILIVLVPAAVVTYARERRVAAAFDYELLRPLLTSARYLAAAGTVGVLVAVTGVFLAVVTLLTYGSALLLSPILLFYLLVIGSYVIGTAAGEVTGELTPETRGPAEFDG